MNKAIGGQRIRNKQIGSKPVEQKDGSLVDTPIFDWLIRIPKPSINGKRQTPESHKFQGTEQEAEAEQGKLWSRRKLGDAYDGRGELWDDVCEEYIRAMEKGAKWKSDSTALLKPKDIREYVIPQLSGYTLGEISPTVYEQKFVGDMLRQKPVKDKDGKVNPSQKGKRYRFAVSTVEKHHGHARSIFIWARDKAKKKNDDPTSGISIREMANNIRQDAIDAGEEDSDDVVRYWDKDDADKVLDALQTTKDAGMMFSNCVFVELGMLTGPRPSELRALTWDGVDEVNCTVTYDGQMALFLEEAEGTRKRTKRMKTTNSKRTIEVERALMDRLMELKRWQTLNGRRMAENQPDYVFTAKHAGEVQVVAHSTQRTMLKRLCERLDLTDAIPLYGLRHTAASLIIAANGENGLFIAMQTLGHTTIEKVSEKYGHLLKGVQRAAASKAREYLKGTKTEEVKIAKSEYDEFLAWKAMQEEAEADPKVIPLPVRRLAPTGTEG